MGLLDVNVYAGISLFVVVIVLALVAGYELYTKRDETGTEAEKSKSMWGVVFVIAVALLLINAFLAAQPASSTTSGTTHQLAGVLTMSPTASCYAFSGVSFTLHCNALSGSYKALVLNNGTNGGQSGASASIGLLTKYSTGLMYVAGTTTAVNEIGIDFTVRRTDADFQDAACAGPCKASVSFAISSPSSWFLKSNVSSISGSNIYVVAQDVNSNYQESWTDVNSNTVVGLENGAGLMSLAGNGASGTVHYAVVFNQVALPVDVPFSTYTFSATITVTMSFSTLADGTAASPVTWSIPVSLSLQTAAA